MSDITVSVIIPCYNCEEFLTETLDSVLGQDVDSLEIVAIDDGSTDGTAAVLDRYDRVVRVIRGPNRGASAARNLGTQISRGRYLQYVDSDDLLTEGTLGRRVDALERSGADVAYTAWQYFEPDAAGVYHPGTVVDRDIESISAEPDVALFTAFWAPPAAYLYSRECVNRIGGWKEQLPVIQDARFALDAALTGSKFIRVSDVGALYRLGRADSLSQRDPKAFYKDVLTNAVEVENIWEQEGTLGMSRRDALVDVYDYVSRGLFGFDSALFEDVLKRLYRLEPGFSTGWPKLAGALARIVGYRAAGWLLSAAGRPPAIRSRPVGGYHGVLH